MWELLRNLHNRIHSAFVRYFRTKEVVSALKMMHLRELAETPVHVWAVKKQEHAREIAAVKGGNFDIVDRRSWAFPYIPEALHRLNQPILKNTPYNLRRFSETPVPRRAINLIKNGILNLKWRVWANEDADEDDPELLKRKKIAEDCLKHPNGTDSYNTLMEAVLEDFIIGGYATIEPQLTPDYKRPFKLWSVDGSTIRIFADWSEATPERPRYAQLTGLKGERGIISFLDDELIYIRDNVRSSTPFGLGCLEVAFNTTNAFLGAQDMATKAGADQIHKTFLWWKTVVPPGQQETIRRYIQNEGEGQAKVAVVSGMPPPEVVDVQAVSEEDLLLNWQELLIRIIATAFNLSAMALGIERDVNRNTAEVLSEMDFASAVVPVARKFEEAITRFILHRLLGWTDLQFEFLGLEDPNPLVLLEIMGAMYRSNAATPDEMREQLQIGPPLPGGIGKLTMGQWQLLMFSELAKQQADAAQQSGGMGGGGGFGGGGGQIAKPRMPGMNPPTMSTPSIPGGGLPRMSAQSLHTGPFQAEDVANMHPDDVDLYQRMGLLPGDNNQLAQEMEEQKPGILETISNDLREYFEAQNELDEENLAKPSKVTGKDESEQKKRYRDFQHLTTPEEQMSRSIEQQRMQLLTRNAFRDIKRTGRALGPRSGGWMGRYR